MKKNSGIHKLLTFLLLGTIVFSNISLYKHPIQKDYLDNSYEVRMQNKTNGLDVGKAD